MSESAPVPAGPGSPAPAAPSRELRAAGESAELVAVLERELRALGPSPRAARLYHDIGRLWEEARSPRNAAIAYQNAHRQDPRHVPTLRSARRLFGDVGNWAMVAQLLEAEAAVVSDPVASARLQLERGLVLEERLGRVDEALSCFEAALELDPGNVAILVHLAAHHADARTPLVLVDVLRRTAAVVETPAHAARLLAAAAAVAEDRAGDPALAAGLLREGFALDRKNPELLARLERHAEREERWEELADVLAARAELEGPAAGPTFHRLAKIFRHRLEREEDAVAALLAGRRAAPADPLLLADLAALHEARGRWDELAEVLRARAELTTDPAERVELELRIAGLCEDRLDRPDEAIERYRAVLARSPGHGPALTALGKLLHACGDWEGLLATWRAEAAALDDPRGRAARLYKAGELLDGRLGRTDEAVATLAEALELAPGFLPARAALDRIHRREGRWAELLALLEADLAGADRDGTIALLSEIAAIADERLGDPARAVDACRRILAVAPDHLPTVRLLGRLAEKAGDHEGRIAALELEAALATDQRAVVALLHRACEILEEEVGDRDRAIAAYGRVLALSPAYLPALRALGRLYAERGRWAELAAMYREEAEVAPTAAAAAGLVFRIGELYERQLLDEEKALGAYREVLTLAPRHLPALHALQRILRAQRAFEALVDALREEAAIRADPGPRADVLFEAAELTEERLGRPDAAAELHEEVLRLRPGHLGSLRALERLRARAGDPAELVAAEERALAAAPPSGQVHAYLELARIYLDRLGDPGRAGGCAEAALALEPGSPAALLLLERLRGIAGDPLGRAEVRVRLAAHAEPPLAAALLVAAAADRERAAPGTPPLDELRRAHALSPDDVRITDALERALRRAGDEAGLATLLSARAGAEPDPEVRLGLLVELAGLRERAGDLAAARAAYAAASVLEPEHLPAIRGLRRLHAAAGELAEVRATWQDEARAAQDPAHAALAWTAAGRIAEELGELEGALADHRAALGRDPLDPTAGARAEALLAAAGDHAGVAALHEARAAAARTPAEAAAALVAASRLRADALGETEPALALLDAALARVPTHPEALERRGELALASGRHREAAQAWAARLQLGGDARHLAGLHLRLGELFARHLGEPARAVAHLQTALAADAGLVPALALLAELHGAAGNHAAAADALRRLLELERDPSTLARAHLALGRLLDEGFGDAVGAARSYQAALDLGGPTPALLERLVALHERTGDLPRLVAALDRQAEVLASADPAAAAPLRVRAASLLAGPLRDPGAAVDRYEKALRLAPDDARIRVALADLHAAEPGGLGRAVEEHRALLRADPLRVDSLRALHRLWLRQDQRDRAWVAAALLAALRSAEPAETAFLAAASRPVDPSGVLTAAELDELADPGELGPLVAVLEAIGDSLGKLHPPRLDELGAGKGDRARRDHAVRRAFDRLVLALGGADDGHDLWLAKRDAGALAVDVGDPPAVVIGEDVATRWGKREQAFLLGRLAYRVRRKNAVLLRASPLELGDLLGGAIRLVVPDFAGVGLPDPDAERRLGKALSRRARKALEEAAWLAARSRGPFDPAALAEGAARSADRAGLLLSGDPATALGLALRDGGSPVAGDADALAAALRGRPDLLDLIRFAISEEHFRLRARLGLAV